MSWERHKYRWAFLVGGLVLGIAIIHCLTSCTVQAGEVEKCDTAWQHIVVATYPPQSDSIIVSITCDTPPAPEKPTVDVVDWGSLFVIYHDSIDREMNTRWWLDRQRHNDSTKLIPVSLTLNDIVTLGHLLSWWTSRDTVVTMAITCYDCFVTDSCAFIPYVDTTCIRTDLEPGDGDFQIFDTVCDTLITRPEPEVEQ